MLLYSLCVLSTAVLTACDIINTHNFLISSLFCQKSAEYIIIIYFRAIQMVQYQTTYRFSFRFHSIYDDVIMFYAIHILSSSSYQFFFYYLVWVSLLFGGGFGSMSFGVNLVIRGLYVGWRGRFVCDDAIYLNKVLNCVLN